LPDGCVIAHPDLALAAAAAATMVGQQSHERRRLLFLAGQSRAQHSELFGPHEEAVMAMVRATAADNGVGEAVQSGRRAVELSQVGGNAVLVAALASFALALYLNGELDEASLAASRAIDHQDAARRVPGHALAHSTLALTAADRGRPATA